MSHLEKAGFAPQHATPQLEIWTNGESEVYIHATGDCYLYPVAGSELSARRFRVRTLAFMLGRYAR